MRRLLYLATFSGKKDGMRNYKIAFTGPESSGKTTLALQVAAKWKGLYIEEFAREYLAQKSSYVQSDLDAIAKGQQEKWNVQTPLLVADTDMTVLCIWSQYKYESISDCIRKGFLEQDFDILFLCKPDIPWEFDPLRENPENRDELFDLYHSFLLENKQKFVVVEGDEVNRSRIVDEEMRKLIAVK